MFVSLEVKKKVEKNHENVKILFQESVSFEVKTLFSIRNKPACSLIN
jgi:hypothetical protein